MEAPQLAVVFDCSELQTSEVSQIILITRKSLVAVHSNSGHSSPTSFIPGSDLVGNWVNWGGLEHCARAALQHNKNCDPMLGLIQISICDAIIDDDKDELRERKNYRGKRKG